MRHPEHVRVRRWTRREYERMIDRGIFRPDDRLELIDGQLVVKEPQDSDHFTALLLVADTLRAAFGPGCLEVYRDPSGGRRSGYGSIRALGPDEHVPPLAAPTARILV